MPPPQSSSIGILGFIAFVASGALLSFSLHKIEEGCRHHIFVEITLFVTSRQQTI